MRTWACSETHPIPAAPSSIPVARRGWPGRRRPLPHPAGSARSPRARPAPRCGRGSPGPTRRGRATGTRRWPGTSAGTRTPRRPSRRGTRCCASARPTAPAARRRDRGGSPGTRPPAGVGGDPRVAGALGEHAQRVDHPGRALAHPVAVGRLALVRPRPPAPLRAGGAVDALGAPEQVGHTVEGPVGVAPVAGDLAEAPQQVGHPCGAVVEGAVGDVRGSARVDVVGTRPGSGRWAPSRKSPVARAVSIIRARRGIGVEAASVNRPDAMPAAPTSRSVWRCGAWMTLVHTRPPTGLATASAARRSANTEGSGPAGDDAAVPHPARITATRTTVGSALLTPPPRRRGCPG